MHGREKKHEKGQSMVEFALTLPILIVILSGLIDVGRMYFAYIFLEEAAAEAALYVSLHPDCVQADPTQPECDDPNNGLWRARYSGSTQAIILRDAINITSVTTLTPAFTQTIEIDATLPFTFITPGLSVITLKVRASHVVISD